MGKINGGGGGQQNSLLLATQLPIHKNKINPHLVIVHFWPSILSYVSLPPDTKNSSRVQLRWKFFWVEIETTFKFKTYHIENLMVIDELPRGEKKSFQESLTPLDIIHTLQNFSSVTLGKAKFYLACIPCTAF